MRFPATEDSIVRLAEDMVAGFTAHPDDFPSCEPAGIQSMLTSYKNARETQMSRQSAAGAATATKDSDLEVLVTTMKNTLKTAEIDTFADPQKLSEIGWGPKAPPVPLTVPGVPTNLHPIAEGNGMIWLAWDRPASGTGGAVWNYIVERRQQGEGQQFGEWQFAGQSYDCEIHLQEQPADVRLEYRAKASNTAGQSTPSNSVSVVLP